MTDRELGKRIKGGDRSALAKLRRRYGPTLRAIIRRRVRYARPHEVRAIIATVFAAVWKRRQRFHGQPVLTWLIGWTSRATDSYLATVA